MLTEIYIEALLADDEAADQVWEAWFVELCRIGDGCLESGCSMARIHQYAFQ